MDANLDKIAAELYGKIETRFPNIEFANEHGDVLSKEEDIPTARFFEFKFVRNGEDIASITISLNQKKGVVLQISMTPEADGRNHPSLDKFVRSCRIFAKRKLLKFDAFITGKTELDKRDYHFQSTRKEEPPMDPIMESKLYGSAKISYQDLGEAQLIIKHSQPVNTALAAGRTMHIESIYIENAAGERFRYPARHINGARALAEHIKAGGTPYDSIGKHITSLSEELAQLRKFKNYVGRQEQLSENMGPITSKVMERIDSIKKEINNLQKSDYYKQFAESFESKEDQVIPEDLLNDWVDRLTIRTFNEELKSVFPYIYRMVDESELPVVDLNPDDLLSETEDTQYETYSDATLPEELELEEFMSGIIEQDASNEHGDGIFDSNPDVRDSAVDELNKIFKSEVKGGLNLISTLSKLIPSTQKYPNFLDQFKDSDPSLDARESVRLELTKLAKEHSDDPELARTVQMIDFNGGADSGEISADQTTAAAPAAPAEPTPPAPTAAAPAPQQAPVAEGHDHDSPPWDVDDAEEKPHFKKPAKNPRDRVQALRNRGMQAAIAKARDAGATLDTRFNVNGKEMTLHDAIEECGMTPMECGFDTQEASDLDDMKKFMSGFFNREERNFTIGGERMKIKLEKEFPGANPSDLKSMFAFIDKIDPPASTKQHHDILRLAGVGHTVDEETFDDGSDLTTFDDGSTLATDTDGVTSATDTIDAPNPAPVAKDAKQASQMSAFKQMMKNAGIQMPRLPTVDGDEGDELDIDNLGPQIQTHVGSMMKGIQDKIPAGPNNELAQMLKVAGIKK
jgi:hypothetical protein